MVLIIVFIVLSIVLSVRILISRVFLHVLIKKKYQIYFSNIKN